ncbi:hypothetical protein KAW18_02635 [candidate division WOR-3 bacterium]|nr:hypothetical protein [candidate division WOR-3 bacterium]
MFHNIMDAIKEDDEVVRLHWQSKLDEIVKEEVAIRDNQKSIEKYAYQCRNCDTIFEPKEVEEFDKRQGWDIIKPCPNCGKYSLKVIWRSVSLVPQADLTKFGVDVEYGNK